MVSSVDYTALAAFIVPLAISIIGGGLAVAWRLGGLENRVKDTQEDVHEMKGQIRDLSLRVDGRPS